MNKTTHKTGKYTIVVHDEPYEVIDSFMLTLREREEFDYIDWSRVEEGSYSASFIRIDGELCDLSEFEIISGEVRDALVPVMGAGTFAFRTDSYFSGYAIKFPVHKDDPETRGLSGREVNYDFEQCYVALVTW